MQQIKRLTSTGFWHVFGSSAINRMIGMMTSVVLVRVLTKTDFAQYVYAQNIFEYFMLLSGFGMVSAVLQVCSEQHGDMNRQSEFFRYGTRFGLQFNGFLSVVLLLFSLVVPLPVAGSAPILSVMSFLLVFLFLSEMQKIHFRVTLQNRRFAYLNTIDSILIFSCSVIGVLLWRTFGLVIGRYLAAMACILIAVLFFRGPARLNPKVNLSASDRRSLFGIAGLSMVNNSLSTMLYLVEITLIGIYVADANMVATYRVASTIPIALNFIPLAFMTYGYAYFAKNNKDKRWVRIHFAKAAGGLALLCGAITVVLVVLAPWIVPIIFGAQYADSVLSFRILMIAFFFTSVLRILSGNILVTQRRLKFNLFMAVFGGVLHIGLLLFLINGYGEVGAAIAHLITMLLTGLISTGYLLFCLRGN